MKLADLSFRGIRHFIITMVFIAGAILPSFVPDTRLLYRNDVEGSDPAPDGLLSPVSFSGRGDNPQINLTPFGFEPGAAATVVGVAVTWQNNTQSTHILTGSGNPPAPDPTPTATAPPPGDDLYLPAVFKAGGTTSASMANEAVPLGTVDVPLLVGTSFTVTLEPGASFSYVYEQAGEYDFYLLNQPEFQGSVTVIDPPNQITMTPIGNQTAPVGSTLRFYVTAVSPTSNPIIFGVQPLPLSPGMTFNSSTGEYTFKPSAEQVGSFVLTFTASDGVGSDSETLTISVPSPNPGDDTVLQGRILDANAAVLGTFVPIVGATITNIELGLTTTTNAQGYFSLPGLTPGINHFDYDGRTANPPNFYGAYRGDIDLMANVVNVVERPIFIMAVDYDSETPIDPNNTVIVNNPNINTTVTIQPHTVLDENGNEYTGTMTLSPVPTEFTPASLPDNLGPDQVITVQPMGLTFANPAPVTFPNTSGLSPDSEVDIWSLDHNTGIFFIAGTGKVSTDGLSIVTISGGIRESSWHFPMPPSGTGGNGSDESGDNAGNGSPCNTGSTTTLESGCLGTNITLPPYVSLGESRSLNLVYKSDHANLQPVLPFEATILQRSAVPDLVSYDLGVGGIDMTEAVYVDTSGLNEGQDETIRGAIHFDGNDFTTGSYGTSIKLTSHFNNSTVSSSINDRITIVNRQNSPFGSGWTIANLSSLHHNSDGSILVVNGDGTAQVFSPAPFDLTSWTKEGAPGAGNWVVSQDGVSVLQTVNGAPTFFISPDTYINTTIRGAFRVNTTSDDDFMGFVFGYQSPISTNGDPQNNYNFMLFDWKQNTQFASGYTAQEGFSLNRLDGVITNDYITFWGHQETAEFDVLATDYDAANGWLDLTNYNFELTFETDRIQIAIDEQDIFDISGSFSPGHFGFYNYSQASVAYSNFTSSAETERFVGPEGDYSTLNKDDVGNYIRRMKDETEYHFNADGLQTAMVDRNGNTTSYAYDAIDQLVSMTDPAGIVTTFTYINGYLNSISNPGGTTIFQHGVDGNLTGVIYPDGSGESFGYDGRHLMTSQTDANGETTFRQYDLLGRLTSASLPDGTVRQATTSQVVGWVDPTSGMGTINNPAPVVRPDEVVATLTDGENHTTAYEIGPVQQFTSITDPANFTTNIVRDTDGNALQTTLPSGAIFNRTFDEQGNLLSFTDQTVSGTTAFTYDSIYNQVESITDPFNQTTIFDYDGNGNLIGITTPLNRMVGFDHNSLGLVTMMTDTLGTVTQYSYNAEGNLNSLVQNPGVNERSASMTYTLEGYLQTLTDPLGRIFTFGYDLLGRLTTELLPGGRVITYGYDDAGNLTSLTPPGRPAHTFEYNEINLMASYTAPIVTGGGTNQTTYDYNLAQQLELVTRPDGLTLDYGYDGFGRLATVTIPDGTYTYNYSPSTGQLISMDDPDGGALSYSYNGELVTQVNWTGAVNGFVGYGYDEGARLDQININGVSTNFVYDADSMLTQAGNLTLAYDSSSGLIAGSTLGLVTDSWGFNDFTELSDYSAAYNGADFFDVTYGRDDLGRITQKVEIVSGIPTTYTYSYDAAGRLWQVFENGGLQAVYTYDQNGNRLNDGTNSATYDDQDRLLTYGSAVFTYTPNGELLTKTEGGMTTNYDYDVLGNLRGVTLPNGTQIAYVIDAADRRIGKRVNGALVRGFLYGDALNPVAELDGSGNVVSRFIYGSQSNIPDYMVKNGVTYRLVSDHLGSVRFVVDTVTGAVVQTLDYDAWGVVTQDTNSGFQPFGFAGGLYDTDTGLIRFGTRDYDAGIGRWILKDTILFDGGDANLFTYVGNDPVNLNDPTGEILPILIGIGIGAGIELGVQLLQNGGNWGCVNLGTVAASGAIGGLGGFLNGARLFSNTGRLLFGKNNYGFKRLVSDNRTFNAVSKQYWRQTQGGATSTGNQLSHLFIRNESSATGFKQYFKNSGLNLIELPKNINALGGTAGRSLAQGQFNDSLVMTGVLGVAGSAGVQGGRLGSALGGSGGCNCNR